MNFLKRWVLVKLGYICPKCGGEMEYRLPCSHGWGFVRCVNSIEGGCDNSRAYRGPSASGLSFTINDTCQICKQPLVVYIVDGKKTTFCRETFCITGKHHVMFTEDV